MAQKPKVEAPVWDELPDLTESQMEFVLGLMEGKSGVDAYKAAYDTTNWSHRSIVVEASKMRSNPKVRAWLSTVRMANVSKGVRSLEEHVRRLEEIGEEARKKEAYGAAVGAEVQIGKACGLYVDRVEVTHKSPHAILDEIAERAGSDVAERLAKQNGIPWQPSQSVH